MNRPKVHPASRRTQVSLAGLLVTLLVAAITWWNGGQTPFAGVTPSVAVTVSAATQAQASSLAAATDTEALTPPDTPETKNKAGPTATILSTEPPTATRSKRLTAAAALTPTQKPTRAPAPTARRPSGVSGLATIAIAGLPSEAHETLLLIERGGPFPFAKDGSTFQNREGLLPRKPRGYYQEFTVITPGEDDRGARRIVAGEGGELYYTDDHYASFREIVR